MPGAGVETRLNAIFDLAKRWQRAKAARRVLGPWWNVLRAGFETLSKCSIATWQGKGKGRWQSDGKGLKLMVLGWGPGGTCFAQVLKSSKCRISTWQGRGKGRKVHRRVSCPRVESVEMQDTTWQSAGKG